MWQLLSINSPAGRRLGVTDTLGRGPALRVPVSCLRGQNPRQIQMPKTYREPGGGGGAGVSRTEGVASLERARRLFLPQDHLQLTCLLEK